MMIGHSRSARSRRWLAVAGMALAVLFVLILCSQGASATATASRHDIGAWVAQDSPSTALPLIKSASHIVAQADLRAGWSNTARGPDALVTFGATLSGAAESPPTASTGDGSALVDFDFMAHTMRVRVTFWSLTGDTTAAHIHSATVLPGTGNAGVATTMPTFPGFPLGVSSGIYDNTFDLTQASSWNPAYIAANGGTTASAEAALWQSLSEHTAYLNIHSSAFPGGEIRGFLAPSATAVKLSGLRAESLSVIEWLAGLLSVGQAR